ncbi:MAG: FHA domain-containing protein, partial [Anaerolineales bacterium]
AAGESISMAIGDTEEESTLPAPIQVIGRVQSWPDGHPREIETVTLMADGEEVAAQGPISEGQLRLDWAPASVEEATEVELQLLATDELGIQATSESRTVTLVPPEGGGGFIAACLDDPIQLSCMAIFLVSILLIGLLLLVLAGVGVFAFSRRKKDEEKEVEASEQAGLDQTLVPGAEWASGGGDKDLLAQLEVLSGPPEKVGLRLPIEDYVTNIGRDPGQVDIAFFPEGNTSVSGHHCTLQLYYGSFYLTDKHSTNGTRVNGQRLTPEEAHELKEGDEIVLGDPSLRGVKLRFHRSDSIDRKRGLDETQIEADLEDLELDGGATEIWVDEDEEDTDSWMEELE